MKLARTIIRYILTWPTFIGWLFPLLMFALFAARDLRFIGDGVLAATWRPWVTKFWRYSTTLARGMVFQPSAGKRIIQHEKVHIRQYEDYTLLALVISLIVTFVELHPAWMLLWVSGILWMIPNFLGAVLRGGNIYRDSEHERSAYAQSDTWLSNSQESWLDAHEKAG